MESFGYWWLIDWVEERSNGELIIEHKGGGEAIGMREQFSALQAGVIDVNLAPASFHFATYPFAQLIHLAKTNSDGRLPKEVKEYLYEKYAEVGVRFLESSKIWQPWYMFLTDVKPTTMDDLKGLKIAQPGSTAHGDFVDATGATQISMTTTEHYSALERGLADGVVFGTDLYTLGLDEVVKYIVLPPYKTENNVAVFTNLETWNNLPKHLQDVLTEVADDLAIEGLKRDIVDADKHWKIIIEAGLETTTLPPADAEKYVTFYWTKNWEQVQEWDPVEYEIMRELAVIGEGPTGLPF